MTRAVLITPVVPAESGNGLAMRAGVWLELLAERFEVDLVIVPLFPAPPGAPAFARQHTSRSRVYWPTSHELHDGISVSPSDAQAIAALVEAADLTVVFRLYLAPLVGQSRRAVLDLDDFDWEREERLGNSSGAASFRALARDRLGRFPAVTSAHGGVVDGRELIAMPNVARPSSKLPDSKPDIDLLFVATLGYQPNADGALWLVREVLPLLPGVRIAIVGASASAQVLAEAIDQVRVVSDPLEVSSWYERSRVAVVPIHSGSGTRIKIAEAWAHARPVVSTSIGAEGMASDCLVRADTAEEFAAACRLLLTNSHLAKRLAELGQAEWSAGHSMGSARERLRWVLDATMEREGSGQ